MQWAAVGETYARNGSGCTATLIGPRTALTAAHCTQSGIYLIIFDGVEYQVIGDRQLPWNEEQIEDDVAIIQLATAPPLQPYPLATHRVQTGEIVTHVSYGYIATETPGDGYRRRTTSTVKPLMSRLLHQRSISSTARSMCPCSAQSGSKAGDLLGMAM